VDAPAAATRGGRYDAVVIGAGLSGLAAGIRIAMYGKRVAVCEKHYLWGGLNSFYKRGGRRSRTARWSRTARSCASRTRSTS